MATHGSIPKFHPGKEDWSMWITQLQYYFMANKVTEDDQKRAVLLSNVAPSVFKLICNILGDELPTATFERIKNAVESHYQPKPSEIIQVQYPYSQQWGNNHCLCRRLARHRARLQLRGHSEGNDMTQTRLWHKSRRNTVKAVGRKEPGL